jgi:uncharacterized RDD family membrane protein YckC
MIKRKPRVGILRRLLGVLHALDRAGRDHKFQRRVQLSVVLVAHLLIFAGAWIVTSAFDVGSGLPTLFIVGECLIIVSCGILTVRITGLKDFFGPAFESADGEARSTTADTDEERQETKSSDETWASYVLVGAFVVQFVALVPLLLETGGPIDSPFAEMTLAIAVFTPFVANNPITIVSVLVSSIAYYALLILAYGSGASGKTVTITHKVYYEWKHPTVWAYFCVNVMILIGAVGLTLVELIARSKAASARPRQTLSPIENSHGDKDDVDTKAADDRTLEIGPSISGSPTSEFELSCKSSAAREGAAAGDGVKQEGTAPDTSGSSTT